MTPMQQMLLGVGAKKKTYMDEVFSTQVYTGNGSYPRSINSGIDYASEGGLLWMKNRGQPYGHHLFDTERGLTKALESNANYAEQDGLYAKLSSWNSNGYTMTAPSTSTDIQNTTSDNICHWNFRKAPGFFDIVTFTGNDTAGRQIAHNLGCVPGMIMVKSTTATGSGNDWFVYHRNSTADDPGTDAPAQNLYFKLNENNAAGDNSTIWNDTLPTSTHFSLGSYAGVNGSGETFVAYLFAGGESNAATARSVDFDGSDDQLAISGHADLSAGAGDYTWECWIKPDNWDHTYSRIFESDNQGLGIGHNNWGSGNLFEVRWNAYSYLSTSSLPAIGQWTHVAFTKQHTGGSTYIKLFYNGTLVKSDSWSGGNTMPTANNTTIGNNPGESAYDFDGKISNLRIVKGTALYTSSFRPPTEPLTNVTNTKLLCCNNSSVTGSTVTPSTISAAGGPTASADSPFDDSAGFKFGDSKEGIIKCGSYVGNGSDTGPEINLGWEPQWILLKRSESGDNWAMYDVMRGITTDGTDNQLRADQTAVESTPTSIAVTSTGFKLETLGSEVNANNGEYIYMAIRRPDGYVGKPADAGTDVFNMIAGTSSAVPQFVSGSPVDFALFRPIASTSDWLTSARQISGKTLDINNTEAEVTSADAKFDFSNGWGNWGANLSSYQSWMWKRHAGFDVVTYQGNGVAGRQLPHSMNKTPEMVWLKVRSHSNGGFIVGHKDLDGGTAPWTHFLALNNSDAEGDLNTIFNDTAPTSTHLTLGTSSWVNYDAREYISMLFTSTSVSKVGSYTGTGSTQTITTGFQPRFAIIKRVNSAQHWYVFDTTRGWASGNDQYIKLDSTDAQAAADLGQPISTGFQVGSDPTVGASGDKYIYYCHA